MHLTYTDLYVFVFISTVPSSAGRLSGRRMVCAGVFESHIHGHALHTGEIQNCTHALNTGVITFNIQFQPIDRVHLSN